MAKRARVLNACHSRMRGVGRWVRERQVVRSLLSRQVPARSLWDQRGASLVEYALLLALIALVCIGALQLLGNDVSAPLSGIGSSLGTGS